METRLVFAETCKNIIVRQTCMIMGCDRATLSAFVHHQIVRQTCMIMGCDRDLLDHGVFVFGAVATYYTHCST